MQVNLIEMLKQSYYFMVNNRKLTGFLLCIYLVMFLLNQQLILDKITLDENLNLMAITPLIVALLIKCGVFVFTFLCIDRVSKHQNFNATINDTLAKVPRFFLCELIAYMPLSLGILSFSLVKSQTTLNTFNSFIIFLFLIYALYLCVRLSLLSIHSVCSKANLGKVIKDLWLKTQSKAVLATIFSYVVINIGLSLVINTFFAQFGGLSLIIKAISALYLNIFSYRFYIEIFKNEANS